jgi:hypothetical protein
MDDRFACEADEELLMERLVCVENALFFLKVKSTCVDPWDNSEIERLEKLRRELHESYARAYHAIPEQQSSQEMATG